MLSVIAHNDPVSTMTANNYTYSKIIYVEIHQVHGSNLVDIYGEGYLVCG